MEQYQSNRLKYFPITLFASVMGLAGLSIVLLKMAHVLHFSASWGITLLYLVSAWFVFLNIVYGLKWIKYPDEVKVEFNHPVRMHFFPAYSICFLLFTMVDKFAKVPFFISWWAYTFPLDAVTLSAALMYEMKRNEPRIARTKK